MFYVPLRFRRVKTCITPRGPQFASARLIQQEINGSLIEFSVPKHRPQRRDDEALHNQELMFFNNYNTNKAKKGRRDHWREAKFFYHTWAFYGPWFSGIFSELSMHFNFKKIVNYPKNISLFHPRAFEQVACDYLTYTYGHLSSPTRGVPLFRAPVNWRPLRHLSVHGVYLKVVPQDFSPHRTIDHWVFFPLADDLLGVMHFFPTRFLNLPREELDKLVNEQPMLDLMEQIIDSLKVTLSPQAEAQQTAAIEGLEDPSLVDTHPILDWRRKSDHEDNSANLRLAVLG